MTRTDRTPARRKTAVASSVATGPPANSGTVNHSPHHRFGLDLLVDLGQRHSDSSLRHRHQLHKLTIFETRSSANIRSGLWEMTGGFAA